MNLKLGIMAVMGVTGGLLSATAEEAQPSSFFHEAFERPSEWSANPYAQRVAGEGLAGSWALKVDVPPGRTNADARIVHDLAVGGLKRGAILCVEAMMRGRDIVRTAAPPYFGPKLMLHLTTRSGYEYYGEQRKACGTYDWRKFTACLRVPDDIQKLELHVGLQNATGTLWVDEVNITLLPPLPEPAVAAASPSFHPTTRFRGVMSGRAMAETDFADLKGWGVNLIRYQMNGKVKDLDTPEKYQAWLERQMAALDQSLVLAKKYGMKVVIDLHKGPGMRISEVGSNLLSWDKKDQDTLVETWRRLAARYRGNSAVWGYDILNEPRENDYVYEAGGALDWNRLALRLARAIRDLDPDTPIVVEPAMIAHPDGLSMLVPLPVTNVIYSIHVYNPSAFTHQGVKRNKETGLLAYPGMIDGEQWNRERLRKALAPAVEFQRKYGVPIYVGEFSAIRWAPGAERWLEDAISLFEEYGWDWTYHAFREWDGWSVEHEGDYGQPARLVATTPRRDLLLHYFQKNGK
ncbi:MAG: cellulase family glycosylhydrolase [Lentisphaeria bacterium]